MGFRIAGWICIGFGALLLLAMTRAVIKRNNSPEGQLRELSDRLSPQIEQSMKDASPGCSISIGIMLLIVGSMLLYIGSATT